MLSIGSGLSVSRYWILKDLDRYQGKKNLIGTSLVRSEEASWKLKQVQLLLCWSQHFSSRKYLFVCVCFQSLPVTELNMSPADEDISQYELCVVEGYSTVEAFTDCLLIKSLNDWRRETVRSTERKKASVSLPPPTWNKPSYQSLPHSPWF